MDPGHSIADGFMPLIEAVCALSLPANARILVAVSGGADSTALALTLHAISLEPGVDWHLCIGHVNHLLREPAADEDESFVRELGARLKLPVVAVKVDTPSYAAKARMSIEAAARELRYTELRRMTTESSTTVIALGHHMDDQAETVLMNLMRGSGLRGLAGMPYLRGDLARPFLGLSKHTITSALESASEPFRQDATNDSDNAWRNVVRHRVVPLLQAYQPRLAEVLSRTASVVRIEDDYLSEETRAVMSSLEIGLSGEAVHAPLHAFRHLHPSLQARVVREMIRLVEGDTRDVEESQVRRLCQALSAGAGPARLDGQLPRRLTVAVSHDRFGIGRWKSYTRNRLDSGSLPLPGTLTLSVGTLNATIECVTPETDITERIVVSGPNHAFCDAEGLGPGLLVRPRVPGDRIQPFGSPGRKTLQDLFVDHKVPAEQRDWIPIVCNAEAPLWIPGITLSQAAAVSPKTRQIAHLSFRPLNRRFRETP